jgi:hypothetical protein
MAVIKLVAHTVDWTMGDVCCFSVTVTEGKTFYVDWGDGKTGRYAGKKGYVNLNHGYWRQSNYKRGVEAAEYEIVVFSEDEACVFTELRVPSFDMTFPGIDVSGCPALTSLSCYGNGLSRLDVSENRALKYLDCHGAQDAKVKLAELDLSKNTGLVKLDCSEHQISSLNLRNNSSLVP